MLRKSGIILLIFLCIMFLIGCGNIIRTEVSAKEEVINTRRELYKRVEEGLKNGQEEISFETNDLEKEDFDLLNKEHDGFYGNVTEYRIRTVKLLHRSYITLHCEINDNYYVENSILRGETIPADKKEAIELEKACRKILEKIGSAKLSDYRKEKRIHDYLVRTVKYDLKTKDTGDNDNAYSSYGALVEGKAVCNGYAQAMKLLCDLSGVQCEMISGTADGENHAWNLVKLSGSWYHVDVTWDDPAPDDPTRIFYHYFNVDDSFMNRDHQWEVSDYPQAEGTTHNYYVINELRCRDFGEFADKCRTIFESDLPAAIQIQVKDYDDNIYSQEQLQFLFQISGAESLNMQTIGEKPYVTLYFTFKYD